GKPAHRVECGLPVVGQLEVGPEGQHAQVGTADENLGLEIALHAGHHAVDDDERADADQHSADRNGADERKQTRSVTAAEVAPGDAQLERAHSGRMVGKRITSRIFAVPVRYMTSRSMPMPTPPMGGMPYSMARR